MELFSLVTIAILVVVAVIGVRLLAHSLKFVFYTLVVILALVFLFGISFQDLINWSLDILLLIF